MDKNSLSGSDFNIQPCDVVPANPIFRTPRFLQPSNTPSPAVSPSPPNQTGASGPLTTSPASPRSDAVTSPASPALESANVESNNGSEGSNMEDLKHRLPELRTEVRHWQSLAVPPAYTEQTLNGL